MTMMFGYGSQQDVRVDDALSELVEDFVTTGLVLRFAQVVVLSLTGV